MPMKEGYKSIDKKMMHKDSPLPSRKMRKMAAIKKLKKKKY